MHTIRLRGPWEFRVAEVQRLTRDGTVEALIPDPAPGGRINLPADWSDTLGQDFRGRVRYTRAFGWPTELEPDEDVYLVLDRLDAYGQVAVNGHPPCRVPPGGQPLRLRITHLLQPRNSLEVDVELPAESGTVERPEREGLPGGLIGEVRLEIVSRGRHP